MALWTFQGPHVAPGVFERWPLWTPGRSVLPRSRIPCILLPLSESTHSPGEPHSLSKGPANFQHPDGVPLKSLETACGLDPEWWKS